MSPAIYASNAPLVSSSTRFFVTTISLAMTVYAFYAMRIQTASLDERLKAVVDGLQYTEDPSIIIHTTYVGIPAIDYGLRFLVTAFLPGVTGFHDPAAMVLSAYFLVSFFSLISIHAVEAGRESARGRVIRFTSIWAMFYQTVGGAVILPILHLLLMQQYWTAEYCSSTNTVPFRYAKALIPALVLGYLIPTIVMYLPMSDDLILKQKFIAFWQVTPFIVNILLLAFSKAFAEPKNISQKAARTLVLEHVNRLYIVCSVATALSHFGMLYTWKYWNLSFVKIFVPQAHMFKSGVADPIHRTFQIDYIVISASGLLMAFMALWKTRKSEQESYGAGQLLIAICMGSVMIGPGATIAVAYLLRDKELAKSSMNNKSE